MFEANGNNGQLYDLYNNSTITVYAQNNTWNVSQQTEEQIETVIFHKNDDPSLGEVIYMPAANTTDIAKQATTAKRTVQSTTCKVARRQYSLKASISSMAGKWLANLSVVMLLASCQSLSTWATCCFMWWRKAMPSPM